MRYFVFIFEVNILDELFISIYLQNRQLILNDNWQDQLQKNSFYNLLIKNYSSKMQFQAQAIDTLQRKYPDIKINKNARVGPPINQIYAIRPNLQLSFGQLRYIAESHEVGLAEANVLAQKILNFISNLMEILQNNQGCRQNWTSGVVRGTMQRTAKINLKQLETQIKILNQLIEECKFGVNSKSDLLDLMNRRRHQIFRWIDDGRFVKTIKQLYLTEPPEVYEHVKYMTQQTYQIVYQSFTERLLIYQNAIIRYLKGQLNLQNFQQMCSELMRQDLSLINNSKMNELIKYTWTFCSQQYLSYSRMKNRIFQMRSQLIDSVVRSYYIGFMAKMQIENLNNSLQYAEKQIVGYKNQMNNGSAVLGRNSVGKTGGQQIIVQMQGQFVAIFDYLTDKRENIFINFYERKLKKRVVKLLSIEERLTHFYKIIFNPDYAITHTKVDHSRSDVKKNKAQQKYKQIRELFEQMKPLNQKNFKVLFEEIQSLGIYLSEIKAGRQWEFKLIQLERNVMNLYLFTENGERKFKKESPMERFSKSRISSHRNDKSFNSFQVNKDEVFEDTIDEFNKKRLSSSQKSSPSAPVKQNLNKEETYAEAKQYLDTIKPQFGEQFMDLSNFKAYLLPKLIKRVETVLSQTAYSEQPLYLHLASVTENLVLLPSIIKPEINEKKIQLIFYPKVNSTLFSTLKGIMLKHQEQLSNIYVQLQNNPIKANNLLPNIKLFMENRLRYLYALLENIDKLQQIAISIGNLNLKKISYDITSEGTNALILNLLLASKQIKVYQEAIRDRMNIKNISVKALKLLSEYIYPNFINSLLIVFQNHKRPKSPTTLQQLLELSQNSKRLMNQSSQYLDTILKMSQQLALRRQSSNIRQILRQYNIMLRSYNTKAETLISQCYNYSCINSDILNRQRIRLLQFIELTEKGPRTIMQIIDESSRKFQQYLITILS